MRATASLISLNVPGMELTGETVTSDLSVLTYQNHSFLFLFNTSLFLFQRHHDRGL